jgi:hypothetical protein
LTDLSDAPDGEPPVDDVADVDPAPAPPASTVPAGDVPGMVGLPGAKSLTWDEADRCARRHGATVVLVAGNQNSGKTTLLLQLWAQFLSGPFAGYRFAGSETLDAFDDRHYPSRLDSGNPYTEHTTDTDMRFLHLRVADAAGNRQVLLMTDLWGELFESVARGAPVSDRLPVAPHAHKTMVIIDGEEVADPTRREAALRNARTLIGAFASDDGLRRDAPMLVLLSKADALSASDLSWYGPKVERLVEFATASGFSSVVEQRVAARPLDTDPEGLVEVMTWMCAREARTPVVLPARVLLTDRVFTTGRTEAG